MRLEKSRAFSMSTAGSEVGSTAGVTGSSCASSRKRQHADRIERHGVKWKKLATQPSRSHIFKYCTVYEPDSGAQLGVKVGPIQKLTTEHRL